MKLLIVFAHHEPKSFGSPLLTRSMETLRELGREVQVSDLHAKAFNPIVMATDFGTEGKFKPDIASKTAGQIQ